MRAGVYIRVIFGLVLIAFSAEVYEPSSNFVRVLDSGQDASSLCKNSKLKCRISADDTNQIKAQNSPATCFASSSDSVTLEHSSIKVGENLIPFFVSTTLFYSPKINFQLLELTPNLFRPPAA